MMATVCIFSCTNDYDPVLIENLGMKKQPLKIITKVLTTKSPNFIQEFTRGSVIGLHVVSENTGNIYDSNPDYKNVRAEAFLTPVTRDLPERGTGHRLCLLPVSIAG